MWNDAEEKDYPRGTDTACSTGSITAQNRRVRYHAPGAPAPRKGVIGQNGNTHDRQRSVWHTGSARAT